MLLASSFTQAAAAACSCKPAAKWHGLLLACLLHRRCDSNTATTAVPGALLLRPPSACVLQQAAHADLTHAVLMLRLWRRS